MQSKAKQSTNRIVVIVTDCLPNRRNQQLHIAFCCVYTRLRNNEGAFEGLVKVQRVREVRRGTPKKRVADAAKGAVQLLKQIYRLIRNQLLCMK